MLKQVRKYERNVHVGILLCILIACYGTCAGKNIEILHGNEGNNDISHALRFHHAEEDEIKEIDDNKSCDARKKHFDVVHYHHQERRLTGVGMCAHLCLRSCAVQGVTNETKLDACATTWMNRHCLLLGWIFPTWKKNTLVHCEGDLKSICHKHDCQGENACAMPGSCCSNEHVCKVDGSCASPGTCCSNERKCITGECASSNPKSCCPGETLCSNGMCMDDDDKVTCAQAITTIDFLNVIHKYSNAVDAQNMDHNTANSMIDVLRSFSSDTLEKAMITPEGLISSMFSDTSASFHFNDMTESTMSTVEIKFDSTADRPDLTKTLGLTPCNEKFLDFFANCTDFVLNAITNEDIPMSSVKQFVTDLFKPLHNEVGSSMILNILKLSDHAWVEPETRPNVARYFWSIFSYVVDYFGENPFIDFLRKNLSPEKGVVASLWMMDVVSTDGALLYQPNVLDSPSLEASIKSYLAYNYECLTPVAECSGVPDCTDGNTCTVDSAYCDNGIWKCEHNPVMCLAGMSCDHSNAQCMPDDALVPCVAVIDEDSSFGSPSEITLWAEFRALYPSRPFCLLIAGPNSDNVVIPPSYLTDKNAIVDIVKRDNGYDDKASDWVQLCKLDKHDGSISVPVVALFIDDTGSLTDEEVAASRRKFESTLKMHSIDVVREYNSDENWIKPFEKVFLNPKECTAEGKSGQCLVLSQCADAHHKSVFHKLGEPEPSCKNLAYNYQCCVPYACTFGNVGGDCIDRNECYTKVNKYAASSCNGLPANVQCCIPCSGHVCALDGSCAPAGSCCLDERTCPDGDCIKKEPGTCCHASETKCSASLCVINSDNLTCPQATTSVDFLNFVGNAPNANEAIKTINPQLANGFIDVLRSRLTDNTPKAMITPLDMIRMMFPNPDVTFHYNDLGDSNPSIQIGGRHTRRELARLNTRDLLFGNDLCAEKFIEYFVNSMAFVFSSIGFTGISPSSLTKFVKELLDGQEVMIKKILTLSNRSWMTGTDLAATSYNWSIFIYIVNFVGLNKFMDTLENSLSLEEEKLMTLGMSLSMISLVATDGAPLNTPAAIGSSLLDKTIEDFKIWYDTCFPSSKCTGAPNCVDADRCTIDTSYCENGSWQCQHNPVSCLPGFSCDRVDGQCKADDLLAPCVAVIDEDSSFGIPNQTAMWSQFRSRYPSRPFCLLIPGEKENFQLPNNFEADQNHIVHEIDRDYGNSALAMDWANLCGLGNYKSSVNAPVVGLFVDSTGSFQKSHVQASYDKFNITLRSNGLQVQEVFNTNENWILPFLTALAPMKECFASGKNGQCLLVEQCTSSSRKSVPFEMGNPEPTCTSLSFQYECCVPYACVAKGRDGDCRDENECMALKKWPVPYTIGDPEPSCKHLADNMRCCI